MRDLSHKLKLEFDEKKVDIEKVRKEWIQERLKMDHILDTWMYLMQKYMETRGTRFFKERGIDAVTFQWVVSGPPKDPKATDAINP